VVDVVVGGSDDREDGAAFVVVGAFCVVVVNGEVEEQDVAKSVRMGTVSVMVEVNAVGTLTVSVWPAQSQP
jgi:hypothetical protein